MERRTLLLLVLLLSAARAQAAQAPPMAGDAARGKELHAANCTGCHDQQVYTRKEHRVQNIDGLVAQVQACSRTVKTKLSRDQINDIAAYLNQTYYRFQ